MARLTTSNLKTTRDFENVLDSFHNFTNVQRNTTDEAFTIGDDITLVELAVDAASSRVVTMPAAKVGRNVRVIWSVEQASSDRVFTRAGSDTFAGNIFTSVAGD